MMTVSCTANEQIKRLKNTKDVHTLKWISDALADVLA
jgi:hypothetical protein